MTDATICAHQSYTFIPNVTGGVGPYTYQWSTGETSQVITATSQGPYQVTITDLSSSCVGSDIADIRYYSSPTITVNNDTVCEGKIATFVATSNVPISSYTWFENGTGSNSSTTGSIAGNYSVTAMSNDGCYGSGTGVLSFDSTLCQITDEINIAQPEKITIYPNPSSDNLYVKGDIQQLFVYDMAGQLILQGNSSPVDLLGLSVGFFPEYSFPEETL